jgi:hypothetical protein
MHTSADRPRDEVSLLEDLEVFRDPRKAHPEWTREIRDLGGTDRKPGQQTPPCPVGERVKQLVQRVDPSTSPTRKRHGALPV